MFDLLKLFSGKAFWWAWGLLLAVLLILFEIQDYTNHWLITMSAPRGIVSFGLAGAARVGEILESWDATARGAAVASLWFDFPFIVAYTLAIAHGCVWAGARVRAAWGSWSWLGTFFAGLAWVGGGCDIVENLALLGQLPNLPDATLATVALLAARVKFALLGGCLAFIAFGFEASTRWLRASVIYSLNHLGFVVVVALLYGLIFNLVGTSNGVASLFWHDDFTTRLLASFGATLLLLEVGIIVYYESMMIAAAPPEGDAGIVSEMAGPIPFPFVRVGGKPAARTARENITYLGRFLLRGGGPLLLLLAAPALAPAWFESLPPVAWPEDIAGSGPWAWFHVRVAWLAGIGLGVATAWLLLVLGRYPHPDRPRRLDGAIWRFYAIYLTVYLFMAIPGYHHISPAFAICALIGVLTMLYALAVYFVGVVFFPGPWRIPPRLTLLALLIALIVAVNNDPYKQAFPALGAAATGPPIGLRAAVRTHYFGNVPPPSLPTGSVTLVDDVAALRAWRKVVQPDPEGPKPKLAVVVVSGGATRSAYWSATVLERLEGQIPGFSRHVRVIAGASGGMVGASCYVEELRRRVAAPGHRPRPFPGVVPVNSLDPVARHIAFRELWHALLPLRWETDRGLVLEADWTELQRPFQEYASHERKGEIPSLIFSPMLVDDGRRLLVSNLDLWSLTGANGGMITERDPGKETHGYSLSAVELFRLFPGATGFKLATAARMNASFPYISPAVNLPTDPPRRVVDAGYYDNFGVQVASAWIQKNCEWLHDNTSGVVLVQVRDSVSYMDRLDVTGAPGGIFATVGRGLQFFTSPVDGARLARYTVSAYRNDQDVQGLSARFTARAAETNKPGAPDPEHGRPFFTTVVFENSAVVTDTPHAAGAWPGDPNQGAAPTAGVALDWYLSRAERVGIDTAIPTPPDPWLSRIDWNSRANRLMRLGELKDLISETDGKECDRALKAYEQALNYEMMVVLKGWWSRPQP